MNHLINAVREAGIEGAELLEFGWIRVTGCTLEKTGRPLIASQAHHGFYWIELGCAILVTKNGEIWCKIGNFWEEEFHLRETSKHHDGLGVLAEGIFHQSEGIRKTHMIERVSNPLQTFPC